MPGEIVPFGKYKGQPVEVLAADSQYVEWLQGQPWFVQRYPAINTVIINNFREPSETPEHNALQARLLDKRFAFQVLMLAFPGVPKCLALNLEILTRGSELRAVGAEIKAEMIPWIEQSGGWKRNELDAIKRLSPLREGTGGYKDRADRIKYLEELVCAADAALSDLMLGEVEMTYKPSSTVDVEFEVKGADAVVCGEFGVYTALRFASEPTKRIQRQRSGSEAVPEKASEKWHTWPVEFEVRVELKPKIGDDYPAVLRQASSNECELVLCGRFDAKGASFEQAVKIFASKKVKLRMVSEAEAISFDPWAEVKKAIDKMKGVGDVSAGPPGADGHTEGNP